MMTSNACYKAQKNILAIVNVGRSIHFPILLCIGTRVLIKKKKKTPTVYLFFTVRETLWSNARMLTDSAEGLQIKICFNQNFAYPTANGYLNLFRAGKGFDEEGRGDDHHHSHVMPLEKMERNIHCSCSQAAIELILTLRFVALFSLCKEYTAKLLFHQSPTRYSDYTVTITVTM